MSFGARVKVETDQGFTVGTREFEARSTRAADLFNAWRKLHCHFNDKGRKGSRNLVYDSKVPEIRKSL